MIASNLKYRALADALELKPVIKSLSAMINI